VALTAWGSFWCFFVNALSFLPLIFILGRITKRQQSHDRPSAILAWLREGFAYVRGDRLVLMLLTAAAAGSLFGYPYINLMPVLARKLFENDAAGNGYLMGANGAGALLAALALSMVTPPYAKMLRIIVAAMLVYGASLALIGLGGGGAAVVMALLVLCGAGMVGSLALCNTMIQQRIPDAMRGRVMSMYTFSFFAFIPFGNLMAGAVAEQQGIRFALTLLGVALVITGVMLGVAGARLQRQQ
jgi:predicted MFS family arabinose efflux permease